MAFDIGSITDVPGVRVGHAHRVGRGWLTGTTVVSIAHGAVPGVDVRGGGPGTRGDRRPRPAEPGRHRPRRLPHRRQRVRAGRRRRRDAGAGQSRTRRAGRARTARGGAGRAGRGDLRSRPGRGVRQSSGCRVRPAGPHRRQGDTAGTWSGRRRHRRRRRRVARWCRHGERPVVGRSAKADSVIVGALAVVNASGAVLDPSTGLPWQAGGFGLRRPSAADRASLLAATTPSEPLNTTIGVIATSGRLTKAEVSKLASVGHDGIARAVRPVPFDVRRRHDLRDGDRRPRDRCRRRARRPDREGWPTERGVSYRGTRQHGSSRLNRILDAAAQCFAAACTDAIVSATAIGSRPAYRDLCPSAFRKL